MSTCVCCGQRFEFGDPPNLRKDGGLVHFACWEEHHSDPTEEWPPGHTCKSDDQREDQP